MFWLDSTSSMLEEMRRNGLLVGGWAMATVLALILGLQGIRSVSDSVTDHRPAPLSPSSVRAALQRSSTSPTTTTVATVSTPTSAASEIPVGSASSSDVVVPHVNGDGGSAASDGPPPSTSTDGNTASSEPSEAGPPTSNTRPESSSSSESESSSESSAPSSDRIYELNGGSVAVHYEDGAAHLVWARPNAGYSTEQAEESDGTVDVRFRNRDTGRESRLRAYWDNGPQYDIEED